MIRRLNRPSHGAVAGYLGLMLGVLALTGGSSYAAQLLDGKNLRSEPGQDPEARQGRRHGDQAAHGRRHGDQAPQELRHGHQARQQRRHDPLHQERIDHGCQARARFGHAWADRQPPPMTRAQLADSSILTSQLADVLGHELRKLAFGAVSGARMSLEVVTATTAVAANTSVSATATCPAGKRAFGGGDDVDDAPRPRSCRPSGRASRR